MTPLAAAVDSAIQILNRAQVLAADVSYAHALDEIAVVVVGVADLHAGLVGASGATFDLAAARATLDDNIAMLDAIERGPLGRTPPSA